MDVIQSKIELLTQQLKETESLLFLSEERVRTLIKMIPAGLLITDGLGKIEAANTQCLSLFCCAFENLIGHDMRGLFLLPLQRRELFAAAALPELLEAQELMALPPTGKPIPVQIQIRAFSNFAAPQFLVVIEDVSRRYEIERLKEEFVAMVTHDLRTPLTSIRCFHELIVSGAFDANEPLLKEKTKQALLEMNRLISMVNNLLDLEKMESGHLEMLMLSCDCRSIIERSIEAVAALAERKNIPLETDIPAAQALVFADSDYVVQVIVNLLSNALKFSPAGSAVRLVVGRESESQYKISISDKGRGIPKGFEEKLFNRYEQAQIGDARVKGGTGLGLAISKKIVEQHGGTIGVESDEGFGSTFWFTLPCDSADSNRTTATHQNVGLPFDIELRDTYLEQVLEAAVERVESKAEGLGVSLEASGTSAIVKADSALLEQVLVRLINKAVEESSNGETIYITVREEEKSVNLEVSVDQSKRSLGEVSVTAESFPSDLIDCAEIAEKHNGAVGIDRSGSRHFYWLKLSR